MIRRVLSSSVEISTLGALLLFLAEGKSGYDIRRLFQATPLGLFSDSPGVVYPALGRLEKSGLIKSEATSSARQRRVFRRTPAGEAALISWLRTPLAPDTIDGREREIELKYVLISMHLGPAEACNFLDHAADAYARRIEGLEAYRASNSDIGAPSLDALDLGINLLRARLQWCRATRRKRIVTDDL